MWFHVNKYFYYNVVFLSFFLNRFRLDRYDSADIESNNTIIDSDHAERQQQCIDISKCQPKRQSHVCRTLSAREDVGKRPNGPRQIGRASQDKQKSSNQNCQSWEAKWIGFDEGGKLMQIILLWLVFLIFVK